MVCYARLITFELLHTTNLSKNHFLKSSRSHNTHQCKFIQSLIISDVCKHRFRYAQSSRIYFSALRGVYFFLINAAHPNRIRTVDCKDWRDTTDKESLLMIPEKAYTLMKRKKRKVLPMYWDRTKKRLLSICDFYLFNSINIFLMF